MIAKVIYISVCSDEPGHILCPDHDVMVQRIVELGFTRAEVEQALRTAFNNPDRAVDVLIAVSWKLLSMFFYLLYHLVIKNKKSISQKTFNFILLHLQVYFAVGLVYLVGF